MHEDHNPQFFSWVRPRNDVPTYFRFGYVQDSHVELDGYAGKRSVAEYSNPSTWLPDGSWLSTGQVK